MKIVSIVGARPQFIKTAAVSRILRKEEHVEILVHTGQHYDYNMSQIFFSELEIPKPDYHLNIGSDFHGAQTGRMLSSIEEVLQKEKPNWVLVYGDTNSTLAGALAAAKLHIPVAHVEAGLRSFNRKMPEEINRILTDHSSDLLFAPTKKAMDNLKREGIGDEISHLVGDVMYDATLYYGEKAEKESRIIESLELDVGKYILATIHRAENTDSPIRLSSIINGLALVKELKMQIIVPMHPRTRKFLKYYNLQIESDSQLKFIEPVGYLDMLKLEKNAKLIITDSGGVQKEAYFHRIPCVVLREETEWEELVELRWNLLVKPESPVQIYENVIKQINNVGLEADLYGNGRASRSIADILQSFE